MLAVVSLLFGEVTAQQAWEYRQFVPASDLLSLHYDHAPDKDDGQSAAADRTILESLFGCEWIKDHVAAVSGAYGENAADFNAKSDAVMDAAWNDCKGWLAAHANRERVVAELARRWSEILSAGGDVWVKEGGQSDLTAEVVREVRNRIPDLDTSRRIHVIQHSSWNEDQTTQDALDYTRKNTHYIRIRDANAYLNIDGGDRAFERAARDDLLFGTVWEAAFRYYNPEERLDFSDTGELMHILEFGEMGIRDFQGRFFTERESATARTTVTGNTVTSNRFPPVVIQLDSTLEYVGSSKLRLYGVADTEIHVFVDREEGGRVRRLYWLQFEGYRPEVNRTYDYSDSDGRTEINGHPYYEDAWFWNLDTVRIRSGSDTEQVLDLLRNEKLVIGPEVMGLRLVRLDNERRDELMIVYLEDLRLGGLSAEALSGPDRGRVVNNLRKRALGAVSIEDRIDRE